MRGNGDTRAAESRTLRTAEEARKLSELLEISARRTALAVCNELDRGPSALAALSRLKFEPVGCDPFDPERCLNLVEQLNQTFTYQASLAAAEWLLERHPEHAPLRLSLGTESGTDIRSEDGHVAAEVFAAVDPANNRKLAKDVARVRESAARHRYVVYLSPVRPGRGDDYDDDGVHIHRLSPQSAEALRSEGPSGDEGTSR